MSRFKLDYDEGWWLLTDDSDTWVCLRLRDDEAFELLDALQPVRERREYIADQKRIYKGAVLAGMVRDEPQSLDRFLERPEFARGIED